MQFTRSLATAWAADNIQANAVLPGWIDTELMRGARQQVPGLNERVLARTPAGRLGEPKDLAGIAVFLASSSSDFITGTAIPVDGGYSVGRIRHSREGGNPERKRWIPASAGMTIINASPWRG